MAAVVTDLFSALKAMVADFEKIMHDAINEIESATSTGASKIRQESEQLFSAFKSRVEATLGNIESHIKSLKSQEGGIGPKVKAFISDVEAAARDFGKNIERVFDRFKAGMATILADVRGPIKEVTADMKTVTKDITAFVKSTIKDFENALKDVGKNAATDVSKAADDVRHAVVLPTGINKSHDLRMGTEALVAVVSPLTVAGFLVAAGFCYGGIVGRQWIQERKRAEANR